MLQLARSKARAMVLVGPLLTLLFCAEVSGQSFTGRVVKVSDGDTITVLVGTQQERVRLYGIDAPEKAQPYGRKSREILADKVAGEMVTIQITTKDRYGRYVGKVFVQGREANLEMVEQGGAWVYRQYTKDPRYYAAESVARKAGKGLWRLPDHERVPPWQWRKEKRDRNQSAISPVQDRKSDCGGRPTCRQLKSCDEAIFQLRQCGVAGLDRDGDGVPCEVLCGGRDSAERRIIQ